METVDTKQMVITKQVNSQKPQNAPDFQERFYFAADKGKLKQLKKPEKKSSG